ncbi:hypothetical protein [Saccharopolyspora mangrovi]|uniref:Uncharacterized protein n=1 Tax=Saccharopolyspora mangrovi TaxID=3082379 RepID=A0ABU6ALQ8_9PSEU|nr:hypothetical protein [Saccharopolyspora sp. S2-29]MEB3372445.1 hypothetical protein [Saccharopolyspora sp. S2-29]
MSAATPRGGRRPRRSTRVSQDLERARQRNAEQLAEQKKREQLVEDSLVEFVDAGVVIAAEQAALEDKVAVLHRKIDQARAESTERVAGEHARQAAAAWAIHEHGGRSAAQVAELLELRSEKEARRLIHTGRTGAVNQDSTGPGATGEQEPGLDGGTAEQHDTGLRHTSTAAVLPDPTMLDHEAARQDGQRDAG